MSSLRSPLSSQVVVMKEERVIAILEENVIFYETLVQEYILLVQIHKNLLLLSRQVILLLPVLTMQLYNSLSAF